MDEDAIRVQLCKNSIISLDECLNIPSESYYHKKRTKRIMQMLLNNELTLGDFKNIFFIRHAQSLFNARPIRKKDPLVWDASLTQKGFLQAEHIQKEMDKYPKFCPEIILVSPLTRALQTAQIGLTRIIEEGIPIKADSRLRECLEDSDDLGRTKRELEREFPLIDFSELDEKNWWYISEKCKVSPNQQVCWEKTRYTEPESQIKSRLDSLIRTIVLSQYKNIIVVSHCGIIKRLTGLSPKNAQIIPSRLYL